MPIHSQDQWKWLAANRPDLLHRWQNETPRDYKKLPKHVKRKKARGR